jgi:DNA-directed RNA polymerase alpha subunit
MSDLDRRIDEIGLSTRVKYCCMNHLHIETVGDLVQYSEAELRCLPNFGPKSLKEVKSYLASVGLHLSVDRPYDDGFSIADDIDMYQGIESLVMAGG